MVPNAPITIASTRNPNRKIAILPITASNNHDQTGSDGAVETGNHRNHVCMGPIVGKQLFA